MTVRISIWARFALLLLATMFAAQAAVAAAPNTWSAAGALVTARQNHTATLLSSGQVLVAGGGSEGAGDGTVFASTELYDPASNSWSAVGALPMARRDHTATLLPSGQVLVAGGSGNGLSPIAYLYDPDSNSWSSAGIHTARIGHTATLLPSGQVLVAGGSQGGLLRSAELYDPASNTWSAASALVAARRGHTATLLASGKVLVVGGASSRGREASAELYDPASNTWSPAGTLATARYLHTATLLPSGQVLVAGGMDFSALASAELYDPASNTWSPAGALLTARNSDTATLLPSGQVLVAGGYSSGGTLASAELYDPASNTWSAAGALATGRYAATATLLPSGQVLMAGGGDNSGDSLASAELYQAAAVTWSAAGAFATGRYVHTATLLPSGRVLVAGGGDSSGNALAIAELYDPASNSWSAAGALATGRYFHTATLLPSGRVLVMGGIDNGGNSLDSAELYDPASNTWSAAGALTNARFLHTATLLPSGRVLVVGGAGSSGVLASAELYDPVSNTWSPASPLSAARYGATATLLPSGKVLVAGGSAGGTSLASAELYDPASNTWSVAGTLGAARARHTATLLPSGQVLVAGGGLTFPIASAELYDPVSNSWSAAGELGAARYRSAAILLPSGQVLVAGGAGISGVLASAESYDPASNSWSAAGTLGTGRESHAATLLASGQVLITGGYGSAVPLASAELADPGLSPDLLRRPALATVSNSLLAGSQLQASSPGSSADVNGVTLSTGFMPRMEGSGGGANNSASNAPVFQVQRIDNNQMRFISNDGSIKVTDTAFTGSATALAGFPAGPMLVRAWVNGVPSAALSSVMVPPVVAPGAPTALLAAGGVGQASVAFSAPQSDGGAPITLYTATANPGGATATCTAPCGSISFNPIAAGSYTFTIVATNSAGDGPASASSNEVVVQAASTTTLTSSLNPSTFGASVTFTATVTGQNPSGTVTFMDGAATLCNAVALDGSASASCISSTLSVGTHAMTASYSGDVSNTASSSAPLSQVIAPTLTVTVTGGGTVSATVTPAPISGGISTCDSSGGSNCAAVYAKDDIVTLIATPATGQHVNFAGDCASDGTVTLDADRNCSATFAPNTHAISGSVANLAGSGLTLHLDYGSGSQDVSPANGTTAFAFTADVPYGANYAVSVTAQPSGLSQTCSVTNASGTMPDSDVTNLSVTCAINTYTVGGTATGLTGTGLVLQLNGGNSLPVNADGSFSFASGLPSGSIYLVTISTQPANQLCTLTNASGTLTNANITNVAVDCINSQAQLTLIVDDSRAYAQYGQTLDYLVTISNSGNATASNILLSSVMSAGLDTASAQWQCFDAGSGAICTASGTGALADTVTLPAGRSLNWIVSVPVRPDASEGTVTMEVSATGAISVSDIDTLVIFRDGFDAPLGDGNGILVPASTSTAILGGEVNLPFQLPPTTGERIDIVMQLRSGDISITIERLVMGGNSYIRIVQHPQNGKDRIGAWSAVASDATLTIGSIAAADNKRILLLEGAAQSMDWPLTQ